MHYTICRLHKLIDNMECKYGRKQEFAGLYPQILTSLARIVIMNWWQCLSAKGMIVRIE